MRFWTLPGPAAFVDEVEEQLRASRSLVVALPMQSPQGLVEALCSQMDGNGWDRASLAADLRLPIEQLFETLALASGENQTRSARLLLERLPQGQVVIVEDIGTSQWGLWHALIREYEQLSRDVSALERPMLVLIVRGVALGDLPEPAPALKVLPWDEIVAEIDMLAYADMLLRQVGVQGPQRRLAATVIARLALWDERVAECLSLLPLSDILAPRTALAALAVEFGWHALEAQTWQNGTRSRIDGAVHTHSALLALEDQTGALDMLVWSAQASIILPLIELHRRSIVQKIRHRLKMPRLVGDETVRDPYDLEVSELGRAAQAANLESGIIIQIARLRYLRNRLAHLDVLSPADALNPALFTIDP